MRIHSSFLSPLARLAGLSAIVSSPSVHAGRCPNVQILLDRSGSTSTTGSMGSRAHAADEAVKRIVDKLGKQVPLGMSIFPGSGCNLLTTIPPSDSSPTDILRELTSARPAGASPIGSAVDESAMLPALRDPTRLQYQILITDGSPSCGAAWIRRQAQKASLPRC